MQPCVASFLPSTLFLNTDLDGDGRNVGEESGGEVQRFIAGVVISTGVTNDVGTRTCATKPVA